MANKMRRTKAEVLEACKGCLGILEDARKQLGVSRRTFYNYRQRWPEVQQVIEDEQERGLDFAESKLLHLVKGGDFRAIAFYLERKGRHRGWGAQQQLQLTGATVQPPVICFEDTAAAPADAAEGSEDGQQ
ncbi:MAG: hypothetical protein E7056_01920 [Lentisphaerae bacterium]|nr:hypothetical protein [Lentisphaerota bacterium]MBR3943702.1 hypothetical protein [Akkermansia sp.]